MAAGQKALNWRLLLQCQLQSKPINRDIQGAIESVCINRVSILSMSCCLSQKNPFIGTKKLKTEDISILKLKLSNHNKAVILWTKSTETLKNHSSL